MNLPSTVFVMSWADVMFRRPTDDAIVNGVAAAPDDSVFGVSPL